MVYGGIENMKRSLIVGGSVGAVVILVLTMFPSVVSSSVVKERCIDQSIYSDFNQGELDELQKKLDQLWIPGSLIGLFLILNIILRVIVQYFAERWLDWIRY